MKGRTVLVLAVAAVAAAVALGQCGHMSDRRVKPNPLVTPDVMVSCAADMARRNLPRELCEGLTVDPPTPLCYGPVADECWRGRNGSTLPPFVWVEPSVVSHG